MKLPKRTRSASECLFQSAHIAAAIERVANRMRRSRLRLGGMQVWLWVPPPATCRCVLILCEYLMTAPLLPRSIAIIELAENGLQLPTKGTRRISTECGWISEVFVPGRFSSRASRMLPAGGEECPSSTIASPPASRNAAEPFR